MGPSETCVLMLAASSSTAALAAVFCLYSAEKRDGSENRGVSGAENHSVGAEGNVPNLPSLLTFFWAQRSPWTEVAQNWHKLPQCCQAQALVSEAKRCLGLTSLPGLDLKVGGSLTGGDAVCMRLRIRTGSGRVPATREKDRPHFLSSCLHRLTF